LDGEGSNGTATVMRQNNPSLHYKKFGFKCEINAAKDFIESLHSHSQLYKKGFHENSCTADECECPFGRTSIVLVKVLYEILKIGKSVDQVKDFNPMFFTHDYPFEKFFLHLHRGMSMILCVRSTVLYGITCQLEV
jgi:engulfment and cell motility protein 1